MNGLAFHFGQQVLVLLILGAGAVAIAALLLIPAWLIGRIAGAARDWPLVADRIAGALERREPLDEALGNLWLMVGGAMRARLDEAMSLEEPSPGRRLVAAGVVPAAQAGAIAAAAPEDLPTLLRLSARDQGDAALRRLRGYATAMLLVVALFTAWQLSWSGPVLRMCHHLAAMSPGMEHAMRLIVASKWIAIAIAGSGIALALLWAGGRRLGWWEALAGWDRLARALVLRRLLAAGVREGACAEHLANLSPRLRPRLLAAGERGDLSGLLAAAGWRADSPAALDRAFAANLERRRRRGARGVLIASLLLPLCIAVPVGLAGGGVMLVMTTAQAPITVLAGRSQAGVVGTPSQALMHWLLLRRAWELP